MPDLDAQEHVTSRHVTSRHVTSRHVTSRHVTSFKSLAIGLLALVAIGGGAVALSQPLSGWLRQAEGFVIVPRNPIVPVQIDRPGDPADVSFVLDNVTSRPVVVLGAETSCDCTTLQGLPITIPAHGEATLRFRLTTTPAEAGRRINTSIKLLLDTPSPVIRLEIAAAIGSAGTSDSGSPARTAQAH